MWKADKRNIAPDDFSQGAIRIATATRNGTVALRSAVAASGSACTDNTIATTDSLQVRCPFLKDSATKLEAVFDSASARSERALTPLGWTAFKMNSGHGFLARHFSVDQPGRECVLWFLTREGDVMATLYLECRIPKY